MCCTFFKDRPFRANKPGDPAARSDGFDQLRKLMYEHVKAIHLARYPYEKDLLWQEWAVE
ncbi:MAG: hypothetical protein IT230_06200 [Flavobacteriales bacterium]|nr:hypothetical protein [Flavobacteriales bacterium]